MIISGRYRSAIGAGAISGLLLITGFVFVYLFGYNPVGDASAMFYWIPLPILIRSMRVLRENEFPSGTPYKENVKVGVLIVATYSVLYVLFVFAFCKIIEPQFLELWLKQKIEALNLVSQDGTFMTLSTEEVIGEWSRNKFYSIAFDEFWYKFIFGTIVTLIASFVFRNPKKGLET